MSERQNIFRPIHKGIRSMLYAHAREMQTVDFAQTDTSNKVVTELQHDLGNSLSNCILCLMSVHSRHEERDILSKLKPHDPDAVALVMKEHGELAQAIRDVGALCDQMLRLTDGQDRVRFGERLQTESDALFAQYMVHLSHEEDWVVPVMWQWFSDTELDAMRAGFYNSLPLPLFETWMRWTLPALNPHELGVFVKGMADPTPSRLPELLQIAETVLPSDRWNALRATLNKSS